MLLCDGLALPSWRPTARPPRFYGFAEATLLTKKACDLHVEADRQAFASGIMRPAADREASTVWRQRLADARRGTCSSTCDCSTRAPIARYF